MASAVNWRFDEVVRQNDVDYRAQLRVMFSGSDVPAGLEDATCVAVFTNTDTPLQMRQKFTDCIVEEATVRGFTVARTDVRLIEFQRGL